MSVPPRTLASLVQAVLGDDYGAKTDGTLPDLTPYIASASQVVDWVVVTSGNKGITLTNNNLELIERWLSAHFYAQSDPTYKGRSTQGASGQFMGQDGQGFEGSRYGQHAILLDYSNALRNYQKQQRVGVTWIGKPPSQQIPYDQRN